MYAPPSPSPSLSISIDISYRRGLRGCSQFAPSLYQGSIGGVYARNNTISMYAPLYIYIDLTYRRGRRGSNTIPVHAPPPLSLYIYIEREI